ncbi:unnamed protein product [Orchesella dallaii]|uniref:Uncharacterized protein n=1 Tax=Orchesella dallaii TaxID=48710 RepID=A0ABP1QCE2_9HEXA
MCGKKQDNSMAMECANPIRVELATLITGTHNTLETAADELDAWYIVTTKPFYKDFLGVALACVTIILGFLAISLPVCGIFFEFDALYPFLRTNSSRVDTALDVINLLLRILIRFLFYFFSIVLKARWFNFVLVHFAVELEIWNTTLILIRNYVLLPPPPYRDLLRRNRRGWESLLIKVVLIQRQIFLITQLWSQNIGHLIFIMNPVRNHNESFVNVFCEALTTALIVKKITLNVGERLQDNRIEAIVLEMGNNFCILVRSFVNLPPPSLSGFLEEKSETVEKALIQRCTVSARRFPCQAVLVSKCCHLIFTIYNLGIMIRSVPNFTIISLYPQLGFELNSSVISVSVMCMIMFLIPVSLVSDIVINSSYVSKDIASRLCMYKLKKYI